MTLKKDKEKNDRKVSPSKKDQKYFSGLGRRKASTARVRITENGEKNASFLINGRDVKVYFPLAEFQGIVTSPLKVLSEGESFSVSVKVKGGGIRGQAEAIRLGLSRALVSFRKELRKPLRDLGYLTRDDRVVERKKAGLKKARRAPQWKKR